MKGLLFYADELLVMAFDMTFTLVTSSHFLHESHKGTVYTILLIIYLYTIQNRLTV